MATRTFFWGNHPQDVSNNNFSKQTCSTNWRGGCLGSEHHTAQKSPTKMALDLFCPSTSVAAPEQKPDLFFWNNAHGWTHSINKATAVWLLPRDFWNCWNMKDECFFSVGPKTYIPFPDIMSFFYWNARKIHFLYDNTLLTTRYQLHLETSIRLRVVIPPSMIIIDISKAHRCICICCHFLNSPEQDGWWLMAFTITSFSYVIFVTFSVSRPSDLCFQSLGMWWLSKHYFDEMGSPDFFWVDTHLNDETIKKLWYYIVCYLSPLNISKQKLD